MRIDPKSSGHGLTSSKVKSVAVQAGCEVVLRRRIQGPDLETFGSDVPRLIGQPVGVLSHTRRPAKP